MRKIITILIGALLLFRGNTNVIAQAEKTDTDTNIEVSDISVANVKGNWVIEKFHSDININKDRSVTVKEVIDTNFFVEKHGIIRVIPVVYSSQGKTINSRLKVLSIRDEAGKEVDYTTTRLKQSLSLKIGDPNKTITGKQKYVIEYQVWGVLLDYGKGPEFYWNITGHEWDTEILQSSVKLTSIYADIVNGTCYAGYPGSQVKKCNYISEQNSVSLTSQKIQLPGEDFTLVIQLDKNNMLETPGFLEVVINRLTDNWGYLVSVTPFLLMFYFWFKKGRDIRYVSDSIYYKPDDGKVKHTALFERKFLPTVYSPIAGLTPSEVGTIIDEKVDISDIVAEIIELARLKYIEIRKLKSSGFLAKAEYIFTRLKTADEKLKPHQKYILEELFKIDVLGESPAKIEKYFKNKPEIKKYTQATVMGNLVFLSSLTNKFYTSLPKFKDKLYEHLSGEVFDGNPEKVKAKWFGYWVVINSLVVFFVFNFAIQSFNFFPLTILFFSSLLSLVFVFFMPKRKAWGYSLYRQTLGLKHYLKLGKWKLEVSEKQLFLEEMLPLALSLGVVGQLVKDMQELGLKPPEYFAGTNTAAFASDFSRFTSKSASSFLSAPQGSSFSGRSSWSGGSGFGGGGSSGGGFGGGGGSSW